MIHWERIMFYFFEELCFILFMYLCVWFMWIDDKIGLLDGGRLRSFLLVLPIQRQRELFDFNSILVSLWDLLIIFMRYVIRNDFVTAQFIIH